MLLKSKGFQFGLALALGLIVLALPRPEGKHFRVVGDKSKILYQNVSEKFHIVDGHTGSRGGYVLVAVDGKSPKAKAEYLQARVAGLNLPAVSVDYVDGLSPQGKRFLAVLAVLIFLFVAEPIPLEITAIGIGVLLVLTGVSDERNAWGPYMHPVVVFIMCCLIFAVALDKAGLTRRLGVFIVRHAGTSVTRFTFIISIGLGFSSAFMHDAAACAIGIVTILPLMRAAGIEPNTNTARFMMLSLPFACSCGGMGSLIGGGRCMVAATFLKEFTGIEISFLDWMKYALPAALVTVPVSVVVVYLVFRPDPKCRLPKFDEKIVPWSADEVKTLAISLATFLLWLTKEMHGIHYSVTGMIGVGALVLSGVLKWEDIDENLEWGTCLFIFGGGISLGLAMGYSGAADYFSNLFFPMVQGKGWIVLFAGMAVFGALITNAMANVAAAALILPIVIPMAELEGVNPTVMALGLGMATSFAMLLVIGAPPNAISYSYRYFKSSDLTRAGVVATPVLLAVLTAICAMWWKIFGLV